jgi:hypothetical protein
MSAKFLILRRIQRDIINEHGSSGKVTVILARLEQNLNCLKIFEKSSNTKFLKNLSSGARIVPCRPTDTTKLVVAFRNKANMLTKKSNPTKFGERLFINCV